MAANSVIGQCIVLFIFVLVSQISNSNSATPQTCKTLGVILKPRQLTKNLISTAVLVSTVFLTWTACNQTDNKNNMDEKEFNKIYERDMDKFKKDPMFTLDKDSVKKVFGDKFIELRTIINKHDPIGLIAIPAPEDEYDSEVKSIIVQLDSKMTKDQIHDLVYNEFVRWFDETAGQKEQYADLAQDIYNWWTKK